MIYKKMLFKACIVCLAFVVSIAAAQVGAASAPEGDEDHYVAIKAGTIITVNSDVIKNGTIVLKNGKIEAVGKNIDFPREAKVIHAEKMVVMPGLVNPCTYIGQTSPRRSGVKCHLKVADEFKLGPSRILHIFLRLLQILRPRRETSEKL